MIKGTVIRDDTVWTGHPDTALFQDKLYVVYRESDRHLTHGGTKIRIISTEEKEIPSFERSRSVVLAASSNRYNCPRLSVIGDWLYVICDEVDASPNFIESENDESKTRNFLWRSKDGVNWQGPIRTEITGVLPDRICQTHDSKFLIATHTKLCLNHSSRDDPEANHYQNLIAGKLVQNIWMSEDVVGTWQKYKLCHNNKLNLCEASVMRIGHKYLALMRENSGTGHPSYACISDDGVNWGSHKQTRMFGCHRPVCGLLRSGKMLTTYREQSHSFARGFWGKNTFACLTTLNHEALNNLNFSIILPLDHDSGKRSDSGYTGWTQMSDDSIFIVNYITNNAPKPYIVWYKVLENEF